MARPRRRPQTSIYETDLTESQPELLEALRARETQLEHKSTATQNFNTADQRVQGLIAKLELGEGAAVRVGDFVITSTKTQAADVAFTRQASQRIRIKAYVP